MYTLYFDGCCKNNPGKGGAGAVLYENDVEIWCSSVYLGDRVTNNIAEYNGLLIGLNAAIEKGITELIVKGDSQLVIQQVTGKYQVKSEHLKELNTKVKELEKKFNKIEYYHVYRKDNARADYLSNQSL